MDANNMNEINSQCPYCTCQTAQVQGVAGVNDKYLVAVKCIEKNHQYTLDPNGDNTEWEQFFQSKYVEKVKS